MGSVIRGLRNIYRSKGRTLAVVILLALSFGIFAAMNRAASAVNTQSDNIMGVVENTIEVRSAGTTGMAVIGEGGAALPASIADEIEGLPKVTRVERQLAVRNVYPEFFPSISTTVGNEPGKPIRLATHGEVATLRILEGRSLQPSDAGKNVALVGRIFAENRGLTVGSRFDDKGTEREVIGIFTSGFSFGDNQVVAPLDTVQEGYGQQGKLTLIWVTTDKVQNVGPVVEALKRRFGDSVDIVTPEGKVRFLSQNFDRLERNGLVGSWVSFAMAGVVALFTLVIITLERTREMGVLKAIGASNRHVALQFVSEGVGLVLLGGLLGLAAYLTVGPTLVNEFLGLNQTTGATPGAEMGLAPATALLDVDYNLTVGAALLVLGLALALGILGSLYPVYRAVRMRPAEALRYE